MGFFKSRGDAVIFLDSDDLLDPSVAREIASAWNPRVSKVQFQMRTIDATGRPLGTVLPQYHRVPTAHHVRQWVMTTGAYPTPPGSGNAYSRWFLEKICPIDHPDLGAGCRRVPARGVQTSDPLAVCSHHATKLRAKPLARAQRVR